MDGTQLATFFAALFDSSDESTTTDVQSPTWPRKPLRECARRDTDKLSANALNMK
jgi:hypothetical protein